MSTEQEPTPELSPEQVAAREEKRMRKEENIRMASEQAEMSKKRKLERAEAHRENQEKMKKIRSERDMQKKQDRQNALLQQKKTAADNDARVVNVSVDFKSLCDTVKKRYEVHGEVEKCVWDSFNSCFTVSFKTPESVNSVVREHGNGQPKKIVVPLTPEQKLVRPHCLYMKDPEKDSECVADSENEGKMSDVDTPVSVQEKKELAQKIQTFVAGFGTVRRCERMRDCLVFEFEHMQDCDKILNLATESPSSLSMDGHSLLPIFAGVPKRKFSSIQKKKEKAAETIQKAQESRKKMKEENQKKHKFAQNGQQNAQRFKNEQQKDAFGFPMGGGGGRYGAPPPYPYGPYPGFYQPMYQDQV